LLLPKSFLLNLEIAGVHPNHIRDHFIVHTNLKRSGKNSEKNSAKNRRNRDDASSFIPPDIPPSHF
jgi:hypothetical protein